MSYRRIAAVDVAQRRSLQQQSAQILRVLRGTKPCRAGLRLARDIAHRLGPDDVTSLIAATIYGALKPVLRGGGLFWIGRDQAEVPRHSGMAVNGPDRRYCGGNYLPGSTLSLTLPAGLTAFV